MEEKTTKDYQQEKLRLEIEKLNQPWYKNFEFWKVLIPTIAVLASLYFTFGKGIIDSQKEKLEVQKEQLKLEITQFELRKGEIKRDVDSIEKELIHKEYQLKEMNEDLDSVSSKVTDYQQRLNSSRSRIEKISKESQEDKSYYLSRIKDEYQKQQSVVQNERNYLQKISELEKNLKGIKAQNKFLRERVSLSKMDSLNLEQEKSSAEENHISKEIEKIENRRKNLRQEYEESIRRVDTMNARELARELEIRFARDNR
tara:strand:- start:19 stop:789 length:771 start_codon:yes stop_codon:yes gene_type:complete